MTNAHVEKKYAALLKDVQTKDFYTQIDLTNRVTCYKCKECGEITKTRDVDAGVTPFVFTCESCGGEAHSSFYKDIRPMQEPTIEWFRPTLEQVLKMNRQKKYQLLYHILQGGLEWRKIKKQ
jgi:RNase P subunit RPR2